MPGWAKTVTRRSRRHTKHEATAGGRAAVFLDRDGTICEEMGYINHLDRLNVYSWTPEAVRKLNRGGVPVVAVTNQSGVARGYFTEELVRQAHEKIASVLATHGARLDAYYYCPHHPDAPLEAYRAHCRCRKPATGMVDKAVKAFAIDLKSSYVVGDTYRDMQLGFNAGARTVLVMTGYGQGEYEHQRHRWPRMPDLVAENLLEAAEKILAELVPSAQTPAGRSTAPGTS